MAFTKWYFPAGVVALAGTMIGQAADSPTETKNFIGSYLVVHAPLPKKKVDLDETIKAFENLNASYGGFVLHEQNPGNAGYQFQQGQEVAENRLAYRQGTEMVFLRFRILPHRRQTGEQTGIPVDFCPRSLGLLGTGSRSCRG